jgi:ABC-2 type transport system permease protein
MVLGLVTVNLAHPSGHLLLYPAALGLGSAAFSLLLTILAAAAGVLISLRAASVRQVQQVISISTILVVWVPILVINSLPAETKLSLDSFLTSANLPLLALVAAVVVVAIDAILLAVAMARFQRARLILS